MKLFDKIKNGLQGMGRLKLVFYILFGVFIIYIVWDLFFKIERYTNLEPPKNESNPSYLDSLNKAELAESSNANNQKQADNKKSKPKSLDETDVDLDTVYLVYTVKKTDNFAKIAHRFNVKRSALKRINNFEYEDIKEKQNIKIPLKAKYVVGKGETVNRIAQKFSVSKEIIMRANKLKNEKDLKSGRKIFIPFP